MIFGVTLLALVAAVAFYHYVQGMFSAMMSAVLAILAALLAISYHELVAEKAFLSQFPNQAHAVALVGLFGLCYVFMRLGADKLVPGNVRLPLLVDKIGAGFFGVVAGVFSVGILAIAAQMLPFGPSIGGYARFKTTDRLVTNVQVPGKWQRQDLNIYDELETNELNPARASSVFPLAVDSMTLGLAYGVSNGGGLAGSRSLQSVHPSYLDELFGQRFVVGPGRVLAATGDAALRVSELYTSNFVLQSARDFERPDIRPETMQPTLPPIGDAKPVVVRAAIATSSSETLLTMSTVALVIQGEAFHPIGSLQQGSRLLLTRLDDPLFVSGGKAVDFVFIVPDELLQDGAGGQKRFPEGSFLTLKRTGRLNLSGKPISEAMPADSANVGIQEKTRS